MMIRLLPSKHWTNTVVVLLLSSKSLCRPADCRLSTVVGQRRYFFYRTCPAYFFDRVFHFINITLFFNQSSRHRIGVSVFCSSSVTNFEVELFYRLQPSRLLPNWLWSSAQPLKGRMIYSEKEFSTQQIPTKLLQEINHG